MSVRSPVFTPRHCAAGWSSIRCLSVGAVLLLGCRWAVAADPIVEDAWAQAQAALADEDMWRFADCLGSVAARDPERVLPFLADPRRGVVHAAIDACSGVDAPVLNERLATLVAGPDAVTARNAVVVLLERGWAHRREVLLPRVPALQALLADARYADGVGRALVAAADHPDVLPLLRQWVEQRPIAETRAAIAAIAALGDHATLLAWARGTDRQRAEAAEAFLTAEAIAGVPPPWRGIDLEIVVQRAGQLPIELRFGSDRRATISGHGDAWTLELTRGEAAVVTDVAHRLVDTRHLHGARWVPAALEEGSLTISFVAPGVRTTNIQVLSSTHSDTELCANLFGLLELIMGRARTAGDPVAPAQLQSVVP